MSVRVIFSSSHYYDRCIFFSDILHSNRRVKDIVAVIAATAIAATAPISTKKIQRNVMHVSW